jgi:hypothetical protein
MVKSHLCALVLLAGVLAHAATHAAAPARGEVTTCDRLAANPEDPDRTSTGIEREQVDLQAALAACRTRVAAVPADTRARYQLARVLFYLGRNADAVAEMRRAADDGYRQAQFVYGAMISNGREAAPTDICIVEKYWLASARAGRQAARISYVRHVLKGRFAGCATRADDAELRSFLQSATSEARDYYERLLVEDLTERLESGRPASQ